MNETIYYGPAYCGRPILFKIYGLNPYCFKLVNGKYYRLYKDGKQESIRRGKHNYSFYEKLIKNKSWLPFFKNPFDI